MEKDNKTTIIYLTDIVMVLVFPLIAMFGWNTLAPHLNCPLFNYWEVFCIGHGVRWLLNRGK